MELANRKPNRIAGYDYNQNGAYFITICTMDRRPILSNISIGTPVPGCLQAPNIQLKWHGEIANKYIEQIGGFYDYLSIDKYVIMPDHIHILLRIHNTNCY